MRGGDHTVRARCRCDNEAVEVETDTFSCAERLHSLIALAHLLERCGTGLDQGDDARLVDRRFHIRIEKKRVQVNLNLVTVLELLESGTQVSQPQVAPGVAGVEPHINTHGASSS